jgi:alanyl-tRNA synthetase
VALAGHLGERAVVLVATNAAAQDAGLAAGALAKIAASHLGGGGGGKADVAQGGGTDVGRIPEALEAVVAVVAQR